MPGTALGRQHARKQGKTKAQKDTEAIHCYEMKLAGARTDQIAKEVGISVGTVVNRLEAARVLVLTPAVEAYREQQNARLDGLMVGLLRTHTREGVLNMTPRVVEAAVAIIDRQAKLNGLDMPTKIEQTVDLKLTGSVEDELGDLAATLGVAAATSTATPTEVPS